MGGGGGGDSRKNVGRFMCESVSVIRYVSFVSSLGAVFIAVMSWRLNVKT